MRKCQVQRGYEIHYYCYHSEPNIILPVWPFGIFSKQMLDCFPSLLRGTACDVYAGFVWHCPQIPSF